MERLMRRRNPDKGLKLIGDAATEDSDAKYFIVMLKYRCNLVDLEAMALLQEISGGPSPPNGRWKKRYPNLRRLRYLVKQDLDNIAWCTSLMMAMTTTFHCCPSRIPTSAFGQWDVGSTGRIPKRSSTTVALSVAYVMSSTLGHVTSAPSWSTPSAG
jgi:hypothetical protein